MFRSIYLTLLFFAGVTIALSQNNPGPSARFSFNNGGDEDEISHAKAKMIGISHTDDRFGNSNSAVYFYGNSESYVNLGNYAALKPKAGTISVWANIEFDNWSGKGRNMNSIIITKNHEGDDFYESYNISYFPESQKITAIISQDSVKQLVISSISTFKLRKWHHLAISYDKDHFKFYVDGKLEKSQNKNFEVKFLQADSVVMGVTANKKNDRFYSGCMDDVEIYDRALSQDEIEALYNAPNPNKNRIILNWILAGLAVAAFIVLLLVYIRYRIRTALKKEKQQMELTNKTLENELRVHRALMNPHFIFNSLNGLQNFILTNATEDANDYLVKFSKLIRKILESNMSDTITLDLEIELLERYLEIEEMRFEEDIRHVITVDPAITPSAVVIPIMMLQPFVENAVWHGLLNKTGDKTLTIAFTLHEKKYIQCIIDDTGVGREKKDNDDEKKSLATLFVKQRLELLNKIHNLHCSLTIEDKPDKGGTTVKIILPILNG
jgi:two-component sensor histidine kinase